MLYMGNAKYWDHKFSQRPDTLMSPDPMLQKDAASYGFVGDGLDLACGDGRNLIYLAAAGCCMTGVDFSETGLARLRTFADKMQLEICTVNADLTNSAFLTSLDQYDFILINHYHLRPSYYPLLMEHLTGDGFLWVNGFSKRPSDMEQVKDEDVLQDEDFEDIGSKCADICRYQIGEREFVRYIWQKQ